ncbi:MAG TPA: pilin [bacterium]|nr:pilin [bacterium]HPT29779.1 pilin [bacterium]
MNKKLMKNLVSFGILSLVMGVVAVLQAHAAIDPGLNVINDEIQLGSEDPRAIVARIINTMMLFLGIIAVVIILLGGFKWMTAAGNEENISQAKKIMGAGIIGLVIILASWGIAQFILTKLISATNNQ